MLIFVMYQALKYFQNRNPKCSLTWIDRFNLELWANKHAKSRPRDKKLRLTFGKIENPFSVLT